MCTADPRICFCVNAVHTSEQKVNKKEQDHVNWVHVSYRGYTTLRPPLGQVYATDLCLSTLGVKFELTYLKRFVPKSCFDPFSLFHFYKLKLNKT